MKRVITLILLFALLTISASCTLTTLNKNQDEIQELSDAVENYTNANGYISTAHFTTNKDGVLSKEVFRTIYFIDENWQKYVVEIINYTEDTTVSIERTYYVYIDDSGNKFHIEYIGNNYIMLPNSGLIWKLIDGYDISFNSFRFEFNSNYFNPATFSKEDSNFYTKSYVNYDNFTITVNEGQISDLNFEKTSIVRSNPYEVMVVEYNYGYSYHFEPLNEEIIIPEYRDFRDYPKLLEFFENESFSLRFYYKEDSEILTHMKFDSIYLDINVYAYQIEFFVGQEEDAEYYLYNVANQKYTSAELYPNYYTYYEIAYHLTYVHELDFIEYFIAIHDYIFGNEVETE